MDRFTEASCNCIHHFLSNIPIDLEIGVSEWNCLKLLHSRLKLHDLSALVQKQHDIFGWNTNNILLKNIGTPFLRKRYSYFGATWKPGATLLLTDSSMAGGGRTRTPYAKSLKASPTPIAQVTPVVVWHYHKTSLLHASFSQKVSILPLPFFVKCW